MFSHFYMTGSAKLPPSWCDIDDLFPHDANENEKMPADAKGKLYTNCNTSVWARSCEKEVIEPLRSTEVTGTIPKWLKGTLLRNGPGNLKVGKYRYQHLFDSSALLHRFEITDGEVTYQRRFVQTEVYKRNMAAQRIVFNEFGTSATPDPCKTIFHRVATVFNPNKTLSDNTMISVYPFGDEYYTFTEAPVMHRIDPKNLATLDKINLPKYVNIVHHTSHPHVMADGTVYNAGLSITPMGPRYIVVCFSPSSVVVDESGEEKELSMFDQATIVASVPSRWMFNPSYMHTFGITDNFFIILEQPLSISVVKMTTGRFKQEPTMNSLKWHDNESTLIHVISRETGKTVRTFVAETFFYLHIINQFETRDGDYIALDVCCYRNSKMLEYMYIDAMNSMHENADFSRLFRARPLRFVLPLRQPSQDTPPERNLIAVKTVYQSTVVNGEPVDRRPSSDINGNAGDNEYHDQAKRWRDEHKSALRKKPSAHRLLDGRIFVKPELLCDVGCETPRINTDFHLGKEYRYFYAISCDMDLKNPGTLIKVDTVRKTKKMWQECNVYPSEPIFVPDPNGKNEDDGVIVSSLVWAENETQVGLLVLDAVTFTEIARVTFDTPGPVPKCLHGWFSLAK
ncbi:PREDICTED: carotenoid isomerooxygenase-like isoform X2 [Vollenhovia emeryi]|uniref:carotenoid isomerooxygenase-like isoform X2 n=1 Tax=Vollenhovia emeryi TaxID=411798 RepID=UPI0005F4FF5F|nr:PREDICTED: carotenoid isomerooxygenase-like isoform X2 [Vollenhovia emeryi]XP_011862107.1 PREDICTED: carotenoid isomerooxygenase-like isoform X2 [Vollenhovia emeryi]